MKTVGGTLASRICGLSRFGGPLSAYMELTAGVEASRNAAMSRGNALEPSVLSLWSERTGLSVLPGSKVVAPSMEHAHASIDAFGMSEMGSPIILEAKTLALEHAGGAWGNGGSDKVEPAYHLQALWYLGVCRAAGFEMAPWVEMPVLVGPEAELAWAARMVERSGRPLTFDDLDGTGLVLRVYRLPWDEALFQETDARVRTFLSEHVAKGVPPAPSEGDVLMERDMNAVARGFRAEKGRALDFEELPPVSQVAFQELLDATRQRRAWEEREEQAKARVQLLLGSAEEVRGLPGGARVTWKGTKSGTRRFEIREPKG